MREADIYIRDSGVTTGPFQRGAITEMLKRGKVSSGAAEYSFDRVEWRPLDELLPDRIPVLTSLQIKKTVPDEKATQADDKPELPALRRFSDSPAAQTACAEPKAEDKVDFFTLAMLSAWDSSAASRLGSADGGSMRTRYFLFAFSLSMIQTAAACALFSRFYPLTISGFQAACTACAAMLVSAFLIFTGSMFAKGSAEDALLTAGRTLLPFGTAFSLGLSCAFFMERVWFLPEAFCCILFILYVMASRDDGKDAASAVPVLCVCPVVFIMFFELVI